MVQKDFSSCCFIIPPDLLYQIIKEGTSEQKDKAIRTLELSESLRTQRSVLAKIGRGGGLLRVAGHQQKRRIVYDAKNNDYVFSLPGEPKRYEEDTQDTGDKDVDSCFHNTGLVYDFYKEVFMRNLIDDNGMAMHSSVHFGVDFDNAIWTGNQMVYGDGSDLFLKKGSVASNLTVTAHELTHGVTDFEANLVYRGQPGALNEHMSDVFGIMCDQWFNKHTVDESSWLIGKDMLVEGQALHSIKEPGTAYPSDKQISHMQDYHVGMRIHYSSGIPNRALSSSNQTGGANQTTTGGTGGAASNQTAQPSHFVTWGPDLTDQEGVASDGAYHVQGPVLTENEDYTIVVSITSIDNAAQPQLPSDDFLISSVNFTADSLAANFLYLDPVE